MNDRKLAMLLVVMLTAAGCNPDYSSQPFELAKDACSHCRMTIVDGRFGGEIITEKGKVFKFDTLECLSRFNAKMDQKRAATYAADFAHPASLLPWESAVFVRAPNAPGPMGAAVVAFQSLTEAEKALNVREISVVDNSEVLKVE